MKKYRYLTFDDRKEIEKRYSAGDRPADIALHVGVHVATIYHEIEKGYTGRSLADMRPEYSAEAAQRATQANFKSRGRRGQKRKERTV